MHEGRGGDALDGVIRATEDIRSAEVRQALALAELAETYSVGVATLVEELAERFTGTGEDGTPGFSEFLTLELGAALGISQRAALGRVCSVLNLKHRHPLMWDSFQRGLIPRWQADVLVGLTAGLGARAAAWVDERVSRSAGRVSFQRLKKLTSAWVAQADPALAAERELSSRRRRRVVFGSDDGGSTEVWASLASRDALALDKTLSQLACAMGDAGDERSLGERRASALGMLSDPATALSWLAGEGPGASATRRGGNPRGRTVVYVHLAEETLVDPVSGVARIEGFGPLTVATLPEFLAGTNVTVRPVVDDSRIQPVDSYEIPEQIRDAVRRRMPVEVFPFSSRSSAGLDLDHVVRYRFGHLWEPGQTRVAGLAPLTRLVHRAKTLGAWKLENLGRAEFQWTSPLGRAYLVGPRGARPPESMIRRR